MKRHPEVIATEIVPIRQVRRSGGVHVIRRWYVTLDFGGVTKKLAVSVAVVRWLSGIPDPRVPPERRARRRGGT